MSYNNIVCSIFKCVTGWWALVAGCDISTTSSQPVCATGWNMFVSIPLCDCTIEIDIFHELYSR